MQTGFKSEDFDAYKLKRVCTHLGRVSDLMVASTCVFYGRRYLFGSCGRWFGRSLARPSKSSVEFIALVVDSLGCAHLDATKGQLVWNTSPPAVGALGCLGLGSDEVVSVAARCVRSHHTA